MPAIKRALVSLSPAITYDAYECGSESPQSLHILFIMHYIVIVCDLFYYSIRTRMLKTNGYAFLQFESLSLNMQSLSALQAIFDNEVYSHELLSDFLRHLVFPEQELLETRNWHFFIGWGQVVLCFVVFASAMCSLYRALELGVDIERKWKVVNCVQCSWPDRLCDRKVKKQVDMRHYEGNFTREVGKRKQNVKKLRRVLTSWALWNMTTQGVKLRRTRTVWDEKKRAKLARRPWAQALARAPGLLNSRSLTISTMNRR